MPYWARVLPAFVRTSPSLLAHRNLASCLPRRSTTPVCSPSQISPHLVPSQLFLPIRVCITQVIPS
ncbi:hypothetical protein K466DRAFT_588860 [Polyporus arcularius HHB13444]|uniref:Uncharacterized protein n=1 Tax=Polyporus arcularius HHB13444 TaxID=1314778 RepID=A0A5C3P4D0_9APHY|nr:hypothetical protein K466DRAFT_588860 [Polyporus arcularius HHB13444]